MYVTSAARRAFVAITAALLIGSASASPAVHTVTIDGFEFHPAELTVSKGDVVVWVNKDPVPHTATAAGTAFDSGTIAAAGSFRFTATSAGHFDYVCTLHPTMKGALIVR
ncbi:MAG TPA: cupredoxin family copper-binding protein [Casimicrobiaceae bacterium]|nr:cupredoxin family copper-binding protein [Casimicrobiaceae bacterium]